jgi:putative ABC transport system permease protein
MRLGQWLHKLTLRLRALVRRGRLEQDLADELQFHVESLTAQYGAQGLASDDARRAALRDMYGVEAVKDRCRDARGIGWLKDAQSDALYSMRTLAKSPGFTIVVVLTLALGVGANAAIFQLLDAVRLRPLSVAHPEQLVEVHAADMSHGRMGAFSGRRPALTHPLWEQIRDHQQIFDGVFAWSAAPFDVGSGGRAHYVQGLWVSGGFFDVLGLQPALGRLLKSADDHPGCGLSTVVVSYGFWQTEYGGDARAVGESLRINNHPFRIVGVAPQGFDGLEVGRTFDVAAPICAQPAAEADNDMLNDRGHWWLAVIGRLPPGRSIAQASDQLASMSAATFRATFPPRFLPAVGRAYLTTKLQAFPAAIGVSSGVRETYEGPLWLLLAMTAVVLLIACVNISNLLIVRATVRAREMAVRLALGASRWRIVRQLLVESAMLAVGGMAVGVGFAMIFSRVALSLLRGDTFQFMAISLTLGRDWRVMGFTVAVAGLACLVFGLAPAIQTAKRTPQSSLSTGGRGLTEPAERWGMRRALVAGQIGLSLVLLIGALLLVGTLRNLDTMPAGFDSRGLLWASIDYQQAEVPIDRRLALRRDIVDHIRGIPGVESATSVRQVPLSGESSQGPIVIDGIGQQTQTYFEQVGAGYFETMRTHLLAGRDFSMRDDGGGPKVAIVNRAFTQLFLHRDNPVGLRFQIRAAPGQPEPPYQIVGLVEDTKYNDLREPFQPIAFLYDGQASRPSSNFNVVLRSRLAVPALADAVTRTVRGVNPAAVVYTQSVDGLVHASLIRERLMATLSAFFGIVAAALVAVGLYGVMSYTVTSRTSEIGIRMALGAQPSEVLLLLFGQGARLILVGLVGGLVGAALITRSLAAMLFGLVPLDPATYVTASLALVVAAASATYIPARRAIHVDPATALRSE